ncbi:MAG: response regulator [Anaerolineae bacterium]
MGSTHNIAENPIILIVEDTPEAAQLMQIVLRRAGMTEITHAANGRQALDYLEMYTPDVAILDIGMPDMSGWEVLEIIKTRFSDTKFPIIILTAYIDPANKLIGKLQQRVHRYLTKPFIPEVLVQAVREAAASYAEQTKTA